MGRLLQLHSALAEGDSRLHTEGFISVFSVFALDSVPVSHSSVKRLDVCWHDVDTARQDHTLRTCLLAECT